MRPWPTLLAVGLALSLSPPARAAGYQIEPSLAENLDIAQDGRRLPGQPPPVEETPAPETGPPAVAPPASDIPREFIPVPDRWRLIEEIGVNEHWWNPYSQNTFKGDRPLFGEDWFFSTSFVNDTVFEPRTVPTPVGVQSTKNAREIDTYGRIGQAFIDETLLSSFSLTKGDTAFKPPEFEVRLTPVFNVNYLSVDEVGIVNANPLRGDTRLQTFGGLQEGFVDYHLRDVSERYDFDSLRFGIQPISTDFRGFLFQDDQLGARLYGNRDNNLWQYNAALFQRLEKDTNSGLNDVTLRRRKDWVLVTNLYRQDLPWPGLTQQLTVVFNRNRERNERYYDEDDFLVRPAPIGDERGHNYDVTYAGWNMNGHIGRFNLMSSAYYANGYDSHNTFSGEPANIRAEFAAIEPSVDFDWLRVRLSGLYASGDRNPYGRTETGFDAIMENPQFAGADTSYWIRQAIPFIGGGGVVLSGRNAILPSLRTSEDEGQSNFINPGLLLFGVGSDADILPELKLSTNANYLRFENTSVLEVLRQQGDIQERIGFDLSAALTYRPFFTQNVVLRLSGGILIPQQGFKDLYVTQDKQRYLYSVLADIVLTY
ncbi:MAG TPA: hypothetical protein VEK12_15310 [Alphaproteobacteria bacterium]|nr:hypothetical protein [Alphaproteobacteria bacterium]